MSLTIAAQRKKSSWYFSVEKRASLKGLFRILVLTRPPKVCADVNLRVIRLIERSGYRTTADATGNVFIAAKTNVSNLDEERLCWDIHNLVSQHRADVAPPCGTRPVGIGAEDRPPSSIGMPQRVTKWDVEGKRILGLQWINKPDCVSASIMLNLGLMPDPKGSSIFSTWLPDCWFITPKPGREKWAAEEDMITCLEDLKEHLTALAREGRQDAKAQPFSEGMSQVVSSHSNEEMRVHAEAAKAMTHLEEQGFTVDYAELEGRTLLAENKMLRAKIEELEEHVRILKLERGPSGVAKVKPLQRGPIIYCQNDGEI